MKKIICFSSPSFGEVSILLYFFFLISNYKCGRGLGPIEGTEEEKGQSIRFFLREYQNGLYRIHVITPLSLKHLKWFLIPFFPIVGIRPNIRGPSMVTGGLIGVMGGFMYAYQNSAGRLMGFFPNEAEVARFKRA